MPVFFQYKPYEKLNKQNDFFVRNKKTWEVIRVLLKTYFSYIVFDD